MKLFLKILFAALPLPSLLFAQKDIYRSQQQSKTAALASPTSMSITNGVMTVSALPDSIGVGDIVQYDSTGLNLAINKVVVIHGRSSSTSYTVKHPNGATATNVSGVTNASIFRAYTSIQNWEDRAENTGIAAAVRDFDTGTSRNITSGSNNERWFVAMYRGGTGSLDIQGWTTGNSGDGREIIIYSPYMTSEVGITQRNPTTVYDGKYATIGWNATGTGLNGGTVQQLRVIGIQFKAGGSSATRGLQFAAGHVNGRIYVQDCIIIGNTSVAGTDYGINVATNNTGCIFYFSNNILYDWENGAGINVSTTGSSTVYCHNNTVTFCNNGFSRASATLNIVNCLSSNNTGSDFTGTMTASYCSSEDATADDNGGSGNRINQTFTFTNSGADDFSITLSDAGAKDFGTNLSGDANLPVTTDILRTSRPQPSGGSFDIGAFEVQQVSSRNRIIIIGYFGKFITLSLVLALISLARSKKCFQSKQL